MRLFRHSKAIAGLFTLAYLSLVSSTPIPKFVTEWTAEVKSAVLARGLKLDREVDVESLFATEINLDNFDVTCTALLQKVVKEFSRGSSEWTFLSVDSALDICALINPWNSMECSGVLGVYASYARSIQEFVRTKDPSKGDLRAACIIATSIAPGRPFSPLTKGSIKAKCEEVCTGSVGKTISTIDSSFCSASVDLCGATDFTLYSAFRTFTPSDFGVAVAVSVLLSEGSLGIRTTFREGCRFVHFLKQRGTFPSSSSAVSETELQASILEYYKTKIKEVGILTDSSDSGESENVLMKLLCSQVSSAIKSILGSDVKAPATKPKKPTVSSTHIVSSEVSPLSESSESIESEGRGDYSGYVPTHEKRPGMSSLHDSWFSSLKLSIKRGTRDIDNEFDESLTAAVLAIDNSQVYSSCISELKRRHIASHRKITEACRKIDPFSYVKCQKLNHFELMFLIRLREELDRNSKDIIVDLKDLCNLSPRISLRSLLRDRDEELSDMCIKELQRKSFKGKYPLSTRTIRKACVKSDYFRSSACGEMLSVGRSERINLVASLAQNLFSKRTDKERLQMTRESESGLPSYIDICNSVERIPVESIEDCVFELRDSLSKFRSFTGIMDIEGACVSSLTGEYYEYDRYGRPIIPSTSIYPGYPDYGARRPGIKRFYKDVEFAPPVSSLPWTRGDLPLEFPYSGKYLEQEYSESRKGYYKNEGGEVVYHDGNRFRMNGLWYVKLGNDWYLDTTPSAQRDFVRVSPSDPRYKPYPLNLYERPMGHGGPTGAPAPWRRKPYTYLSPSVPTYTPGYSPLQAMYGKPGLYPTVSHTTAYRRCEHCSSWIPLGHKHVHTGDDGVHIPVPGAEVTVREPYKGGKVDQGTLFKEKSWGPDGSLLGIRLVHDPDARPEDEDNKRSVGTQTTD
ncbi:hypothetical protein HWI79_2110 [Cryptosporidium felis]|nr:hypothetical protein HWI79_2110 [Cryptosporidium felis]